MKKLLLLLSLGSIALTAGAQSNSSVIFTRQYGAEGIRDVKGVHPSRTAHANSTARTTSVGGSSWFCFAEAGNDGTSGITQGAVDLYQDSTLYVAAGSPPFYWWCHGLGTSLDPKSLYFNGLYANTTIAAPSITVSSTDAYTVDSVEILGFYNRIKNYTDTLYIDVVAAPSDSVFFVTWHGTNLISYGITGGTDTTFTTADPYYEHVSNSISSTYCPTVQHIQYILNATTAADTLAGGLMDLVFKIPTAVSVPANGNVVAYAHLASGHAYPMGTDIDSANTFAFISYDDAHAPLQLTSDANSGLVCTSDEKYGTASAEMLGTYPILVPSYFYTAPVAVHEPWFNFHVVCPTCNRLDVASVKSNLSGVNAYPNPSASTLNIAYTLANSTNVTVTLTNTMGQVVASQTINNATSGKATFNTSALPAGVYAYSVIANGEHTTGNVAVAH